MILVIQVSHHFSSDHEKSLALSKVDGDNTIRVNLVEQDTDGGIEDNSTPQDDKLGEDALNTTPITLLSLDEISTPFGKPLDRLESQEGNFKIVTVLFSEIE